MGRHVHGGRRIQQDDGHGRQVHPLWLQHAGSTGAELSYGEGQPYNKAVPQAVVDELDGLKKKFASGELKITVTKEDARGGI